MKLIVGLGNPGGKYKNNRHNVGHMVVGELARQIKNSKFKVVKLQTYMNESGPAIKKLTTHYSLPTTSLYVVHDDLDIRLGEYKIQKGKGPKLHRGVESVERALVTKDFWRVRVGVDNRKVVQVEQVGKVERIPGEEYVLQDFTPEERVIVEKVTKEVVAQLKSII